LNISPEEKQEILRRELQRRLELGERAMHALESLTPSGSEFVNDPETCTTWVKKVRHGQLEIIRKFSQEAKASKALAEELRAALSDLLRSCIQPGTLGTRVVLTRAPAELYVLAACAALKKCEKPQPQLSGSLT
jgi:hypothetical protein